VYFIKRKANIYNVASGGYTRINEEKKWKEGEATRNRKLNTTLLMSERASREAAGVAVSRRASHVRQ
jgi:hypothetical protein